MEGGDRETLFLDADDVIGLYADIFSITEQQASDHLRSREVLEGATGRPRQYAYYAQADPAMQAAVLAHGIAEGQPFIDGNKRAALASLRTLLLANGYQVTASQRGRADWMLRLSEGASEEDLASWIRPTMVQVSPD